MSAKAATSISTTLDSDTWYCIACPTTLSDPAPNIIASSWRWLFFLRDCCCAAAFAPNHGVDVVVGRSHTASSVGEMSFRHSHFPERSQPSLSSSFSRHISCVLAVSPKQQPVSSMVWSRHSLSLDPFTINSQLFERSHELRSVLALHMAFDLGSGPLQQPTSMVVVGDEVVVITQSLGSVVSSHVQLLRSQPT